MYEIKDFFKFLLLFSSLLAFRMINCKPAAAATPVTFKLDKLDESPNMDAKQPYPLLVGSLIRLSNSIRPNMSCQYKRRPCSTCCWDMQSLCPQYKHTYRCWSSSFYLFRKMFAISLNLSEMFISFLTKDLLRQSVCNRFLAKIKLFGRTVAVVI